MSTARLAAGVALTVLLSCCDGAGDGLASRGDPRSVSVARLGGLAGRRIFFGHQSVGVNIIDGMRDVLHAAELQGFAFVETRDPRSASGAAVLHATLGANGDPLGKIRDFDAIMRAGMAEQVDIAFMKLCYVDIQPDTNVEELFRTYRDTLARLTQSFPKTTFVHCTVPLVTRERGLKAIAKSILGRPVRGTVDNLRRQELNELLRAAYAGTGRLFDLARFESTGTDGRQQSNAIDGRPYFVLEESYAADEGHLNEHGRRFIGGQLLAFLAGIP